MVAEVRTALYVATVEAAAAVVTWAVVSGTTEVGNSGNISTRHPLFSVAAAEAAPIHPTAKLSPTAATAATTAAATTKLAILSATPQQPQ